MIVYFRISGNRLFFLFVNKLCNASVIDILYMKQIKVFVQLVCWCYKIVVVEYFYSCFLVSVPFWSVSHMLALHVCTSDSYCQVPAVTKWQQLLSDSYCQVTAISKYQQLPSTSSCQVPEIAKWQLLPSGSYCQVPAVAKWQLLPSDRYCKVPAVAKWQKLLSDIYCQMTAIAKWQLLPSDSYCQVPAVAKGQQLPSASSCQVTEVAKWQKLPSASSCQVTQVATWHKLPSDSRYIMFRPNLFFILETFICTNSQYISMEMNISRFVVSNIIYNKYVCIFYRHSSYSTVHFI